MEDISDSLRGLHNISDLIPSLVKRMDAEEARPDQQKAMLKEYVRNWDLLFNAIKDMRANEQNVTDKLLKQMDRVNKVVNDKRIVIDEQVLQEITQLVEVKTGFNLQSYIAQVQAEAIKSQFQSLRDDLKKQTCNVTDEVKKLTEAQNKRIEAIENNERHIERINKALNSICVFMAVLFLLQMFTNFTGYISAFTHHFWMSLIITAVIVIVACIIAYFKVDKDDSNGY